MLQFFNPAVGDKLEWLVGIQVSENGVCASENGVYVSIFGVLYLI